MLAAIRLNSNRIILKATEMMVLGAMLTVSHLSVDVDYNF